MMNTVRTKYRGKHTHRYKDNPLEKAFALAWQEHNDHHLVLAALLSDGKQSLRPSDPAQPDYDIANTVIQWLGSPVGQNFLIEVLKTKHGAYVRKELQDDRSE